MCGIPFIIAECLYQIILEELIGRSKVVSVVKRKRLLLIEYLIKHIAVSSLTRV